MTLLEPGRELDAKVAEVLGWTQLRRTKLFTPQGEDLGYTGDLCGYPPGKLTLQNVPPFSAHTSAAMTEPWEWLKACNPSILLERSAWGRWTTNLGGGGSYPTEALAICAAVLAAKESA